MLKTQHPSDLSGEQWQLIHNLISGPPRRGRKRIDRRLVLNAVLYMVRTGCQRRMIPRNFPHWNTVYGVYRQWIHS